MSAPADSYRIRWANVQYGNGYSLSRERMCIAERRLRFFGWWPVTDGYWRFSEVQAERDIERDRELRLPCPKPRLVA